MKTVISQPMYFPWCGLINQILLCDVFVNYDDVQLSRGFYNRVQVKRQNQVDFITIPLKNKKQKTLIMDAVVSYDCDWVSRHKAILEESFRYSKYKRDAIEIFEKVHETKFEKLSDLTFKSILETARYFDLLDGRTFLKSSNLNIGGKGSERLLKITKQVGGTEYITGHGALNYLDHSIFEEEKVKVSYMNYNIREYTQHYDEFTPFVTSLDAIANLGKKAINVLQSSLIRWDKIEDRNQLLKM
ncbi:WbqC family protein [Planktomarina temperata]|nr:WbqC family protein [Planktomarina temperata]